MLRQVEAKNLYLQDLLFDISKRAAPHIRGQDGLKIFYQYLFIKYIIHQGYYVNMLKEQIKKQC